MSRDVVLALAFLYGSIAVGQQSASVEGVLRTGGAGVPVGSAYVGVLTNSFDVAGQTTSGVDGRFSVTLSKPLSQGYLMVQPAAEVSPDGLGIYAVQPRIFLYSGEVRLELSLPEVGCIVLKGYDRDGNLMRWKDYRARGTFGDQFLYLTSLDDEARPAVAWPVFDQVARDQGQPRDLGLPALVTVPGAGLVPQVLFWDVPDYGRLLLRADNAGEGFVIANLGEACVVELNVELARTAVNQLKLSGHPDAATLQSRLAQTETLESPARAAAADDILADALRMRDTYLLEEARRTIPQSRMGAADVLVTDRQGKPVAGAVVTITQLSSDFLFGVFEGSPYNAKAFDIARDAGFNLATVLLGWGWTDTAPPDSIQKTFGIRALAKHGYSVKAHGVVWLQDYGILPDRARSMSSEALLDAMLAHESSLLSAFAEDVSVWEAMNEPNVTNVVAMPRTLVHDLIRKSADQIAQHGLPLINGAHEGDFGRKFALYLPDGSPENDWNMTYSAFLREAAFVGSLNPVGIVGLQYYPGFHFNASFGGLQGPATTPGWFHDLLDRYAAFERPLHITEFSLPSTYDEDWTSGYWREPWNEAAQADYAEIIYTLAFAHPAVHSISWWDIMDTKSSVVTGGLLHADGSPKPVFNRLVSLLDDWTRHTAEGATDASGKVALPGYGGDYIVRVTFPGGEKREERIHIQERASTIVEFSAGSL